MNFQYHIQIEENKIYEAGDLSTSTFNFIFYDMPLIVFNYYHRSNIYAIIEALGDIQFYPPSINDRYKRISTNKIKIIKILNKDELIKECGNKVFNVWSGEYHFKNCLYHRDNDQPAIIFIDGSQEWYQNGKLHRDNDQPAYIYNNGTRKWYKNGKLHRDNDKPASISNNGTQEWYQNGLIHRDNDKPATIFYNGTQVWYKNNIYWRENDLRTTIDNDNKYYI